MKALVLSGGGSKGQYHVGVVQALFVELEKTYDIYAGVSVGALVAAFLAQFKKDEEVAAVHDLEDLFSSIRTKDIYKRWFPFGKLHAPWKPAMFSAEPLRELIRENLNPAFVKGSGKRLRIGTTSLTSGQYHAFTEADEPLRDIVYGSSAFPGAFEPIKFGGGWWADGGVRSVTPIHAAIIAGAEEIDVVMCHPNKSQVHGFDGEPRTFEVMFRTVELMNDQIVEDDLKKALLYNRIIELGGEPWKKNIKITVIRPEKVLNKDSLNFDPDEAVRLQQTGFKDALQAFRKS